MTNWFEDEAFWREMRFFLFGEERIKTAASEVEQMIELAQIGESARVLDLPCGVGRHALEFARRGRHVTAVDLNKPDVDEAAANASREDVSVEFVLSDMRDFTRDGAFDVALNLFTSLGYFEDLTDDQRVLDNYFKSLKASGVLIIDTVGKEFITQRMAAERTWLEGPDGSFFLEERNLKSGFEWIDNRWILVKDGKLSEFRFGHRLYGATDLKRGLKQSGFEQIDFFGGLDGRPYDRHALRLVAVARKE